jgi:wyosine [tRNA(Phe)-imidazoG37] synthetase (radical SAM superfamily)
VDLVPYKTCSLDCVYCEVGCTTTPTTEVREYVSTREIIRELDTYMQDPDRLDYITFSGSGEPLLHSGIGTILGHLKRHYPEVKTALLTNATLLARPGTAESLRGLDLILPSLDAASQDVFERINRPREGIRVDEVIEGLRSFRAETGITMWVELFVLPGYNDTPEELQLLKQALESIAPDRVQLNTLDRPGACADLEPASQETLHQIAIFMAPLQCEVVGGFSGGGEPHQAGDRTESILQILRRRPCTSRDLAEALGVHLNEMNKQLRALYQQNRIFPVEGSRGVFWKVLEGDEGKNA